MRLIHKLIDTLAAKQVVVWEDEIDIHLHSRIGPDSMRGGEQKTVPRPGKNAKHYVAGVCCSSMAALMQEGRK